MIKYSALFILFFLSIANAKFYEVTSIDEIMSFATPNSIFLFDLDRTIIADSSSFTSLTAEPVESQTAQRIAELQAKGIHVLALSRRKSNEVERTISQLKSLGIDFTKSSPKTDVTDFGPAVTYKDGILFASRQSKGPILATFLEKINLKPSNIILLDDQWFNIESVGESMAIAKLSYDGFYYRAEDVHANTFSAFRPIQEVLEKDMVIEPHTNVILTCAALFNE